MKPIYLITILVLLLGSNVATFFVTSSSYQIAENNNQKTIEELNIGSSLDTRYTNLVSDYTNEIARQNSLLHDLAVEAVQINPSEKNINALLAKLQVYVDDTAKIQQKIEELKKERHDTFATFKYAKIYQVNKTATGSANYE